MELLGEDIPDHLKYAGELRLAHRDASLDELGHHADLPLTKDAVAGRIRRLLAMADKLCRGSRRAGNRSQPAGRPRRRLNASRTGSERRQPPSCAACTGIGSRKPRSAPQRSVIRLTRRSNGDYTSLNLAYDYSALEPSISGTIMELHHQAPPGVRDGANTALAQLAEARFRQPRERQQAREGPRVQPRRSRQSLDLLDEPLAGRRRQAYGRARVGDR